MPVITGRMLGRKKPLFADWSIDLPPAAQGESGLTLRRLMQHVVREQVMAFEKRQADQQGLRALTQWQINDAAELGKITMGASEVGPQKVDVDAAIDAACVAFEDGLVIVVIDEVQQRELDREIFLSDTSQITFLRMTLLAGG